MSEQPTPSAHPDRELLEQIVEERFAPVSFSVNRKRISDRVLQTCERVRQLAHSLLQKPDFSYLKGDFVVDNDEDGTMRQIMIPKIAALVLGVSARVARDWERIRGDVDVRTGNVFEEFLSHLEDAPATDELVAAHPEWTGPIRALARDVLESGGATEQFQNGINAGALASNQAFIVDALPPGHDVEQMHINAVGTVRRLQELPGAERAVVEREVKTGWNKWKDLVKGANETHLPDILRVYESIKMKPEDLLDLVSPEIRTRKAAQARVESQPRWFLEDPDAELLEDMFRNGKASVLYDAEQASVIGYCGVLTTPDTVRKYMAKHYGFNSRRSYVSTDQLPKEAFPNGPRGERTEVDWLNKNYALYLFQNIDRIAVSVEIAVSDVGNVGKETRKTSGAATALKLHNYQQALMTGKSHVLVRHLEILSVNGEPVPSAMNRAGRMFIEILKGHPIGCHTEYAKRSDGIHVLVNWHDYIANLTEAINTIKEKQY